MNKKLEKFFNSYHCVNKESFKGWCSYKTLYSSYKLCMLYSRRKKERVREYKDKNVCVCVCVCMCVCVCVRERERDRDLKKKGIREAKEEWDKEKGP